MLEDPWHISRGYESWRKGSNYNQEKAGTLGELQDQNLTECG